MMLVYALQHNKTKRIYVGCTERVGRIDRHLSSLKSGKHKVELMQRDCDENGLDFTAYTLEIVDGVGWDAEKKWMQYFCTGDERYGYNYKDVKATCENPVDRRNELIGFPIYNESAWFNCALTGRYIDTRMKSSRNELEFRTKVICQMKRVGYDYSYIHRRTRYSEKALEAMINGKKKLTKAAIEAIANAVSIDLIN